MNSAGQSSLPSFGRTAWRTLAHFCALRRLRLTVCLIIAADALVSFTSKYDFNNIREVNAFVGLVCVLVGLTLLLTASDEILSQTRMLGGSHNNARKVLQFGSLTTLFGLCILFAFPKNVVLVLAPFLLLPIQRVWRANRNLASPPAPTWTSVVRTFVERTFRPSVLVNARAGAKSSGHGQTPKWAWPAPLPSRLSWYEERLLRSRRYAPLLMFPLVSLALVRFDWPFGSISFHEIWEMHCLALSFVGLAIRAFTVGHAPDEGSHDIKRAKVKALFDTSGMYSVVRHPLYIGDFLIGLGVVLVPFVWWLPVVYSTVFFLYYARVMSANEKLLRASARSTFDRWASITPACIPRISLWRPSEYPFSFRSVFRREHKALLLTVAMHAAIEWLEHWLLEQRIITELFWILLVSIGFGAFVTVYVLEKYTQVLTVEPRYEC